MAPDIRVTNNIKGLRETLCLAQWLGGRTGTGINASLYKRRIQELIDELDKHRPLGPDGRHGDRHTTTCGCKDKPGHGPWCDHRACVCKRNPNHDVFVCSICGHDYRAEKAEQEKVELPPIPDVVRGHGPWCDHRECPSCWASSCRGRKCLSCGHDWSVPAQKSAKVK